MKKLNPFPDQSKYIQIYESIRDVKIARVKTPLIHNHAFVQERYSALNLETHSSLSQMLPDSRAEPIKDCLLSCYYKPTKPLNLLKVEIKQFHSKHDRVFCPMCETTINQTFDHYLPSSLFPEFSVHAANLIPCCFICNSTKNNNWISDLGVRQYLHFYLDDIPDDVFLSVALHTSEGRNAVGATFKLVKPAVISEPIWNLIISHFDKLNILEKYNDLSNEEISKIINSCKSFIAVGGVDVISFLISFNDRESIRCGKNNWRVLLLSALANYSLLKSLISTP